MGRSFTYGRARVFNGGSEGREFRHERRDVRRGYYYLFERQRRYSEIGERLLGGLPRADFGGRFDPTEWRTAAEQSDHGKRTLAYLVNAGS